MKSGMVRLGIPVMALLAAACSNSVELPGGDKVRVINETLPSRGTGAYALVYRTALSPEDCATISKELAAVWAAVRPRADKAKATSASIIAEASSGASAVVAYGQPAQGWKQSRQVVGCEGLATR